MAITVIHEIAHHFGIDDDRLHELGWALRRRPARQPGSRRPPSAMNGSMGIGCRACAAGLEHCHGALIHHAYRRDECTEDDCAASAVAHELHIDCERRRLRVRRGVSKVASAHRVG